MTETEYDDELIDFIRSFDAFIVNKQDEEEQGHFNPFNLVPEQQEVGVALGSYYFWKVLCEFAAMGNHNEFERLFNECAGSEVWEYIAIKTAVNYTPKHRKDDKFE